MLEFVHAINHVLRHGKNSGNRSSDIMTHVSDEPDFE